MINWNVAGEATSALSPLQKSCANITILNCDLGRVSLMDARAALEASMIIVLRADYIFGPIKSGHL